LASLRSLYRVAPARVGSAGSVPEQYGLFRRRAEAIDRLPTVKGFSRGLVTFLDSYDPRLIRRIANPPLPGGHAPLSAAYVVAGEGFGSAFTLARFPCVRDLPAHKRHEIERQFAQVRASSPVGPAFCFEAFFRSLGKTVGGPAGFCDTFADAATGYGANEITLDSDQPQRASIVPDGVATVVLRYRRHAKIIAAVRNNTYWVSVPDYVPYAQGPPLSHSAAVRRAIVQSLPMSVRWLGPDGHVVRTFTPPAAYVNYLVAIYKACQAATCGA
jgi:hypothetical protein